MIKPRSENGAWILDNAAEKRGKESTFWALGFACRKGQERLAKVRQHWEMFTNWLVKRSSQTSIVIRSKWAILAHQAISLIKARSSTFYILSGERGCKKLVLIMRKTRSAGFLQNTWDTVPKRDDPNLSIDNSLENLKRQVSLPYMSKDRIIAHSVEWLWNRREKSTVRSSVRSFTCTALLASLAR